MTNLQDSTKATQYDQIIERIFLDKYTAGAEEITFERQDIVRAATGLRIARPENLGDVVYTYRYRRKFPIAVQEHAPPGKDWIIRGIGRGLYQIIAKIPLLIVPNPAMAETKVPDATPGVIALYALNDEQALLAKLRYNRLIDIFTGVTCYSLQNHLRTTVKGIGQVETDEIYIGIDRRGVHYVFPVQAKGGKDTQNIVQIEQDFALCKAKFPDLVCRPIAAQFMDGDVIALFDFEDDGNDVKLLSEKHYRLIAPEDMKPDDLRLYVTRPLA